MTKANEEVKKVELSESQMDQVTNDTAAILKAQKKVKIRLHLNPDTKKKLEAEEEAGKKVAWPFHFVSINGYNYQIHLGKTVEVPQSVAEVLEQAGLI